MSSTNKSAPSGIVTTETNERVIPASRRADGTLRKERRVRPGFVPKEDIIRYKNKFVAEREPVSSPKVIEGEELETPANEENDQEIDQLQNKMTNIKISSEENLDKVLLNEEKEKMSKLPQLIEELNTLKGN
ncbi:19059_t:CDS:2 [Gigaspora margarita]|uniref:19059_t:CDS:1 n=1 Tax=Gigaspora margarita TaxID=4874 RepID=A0ABN7V3D6_GIGMA|nr:19059_t:CDS:2 [Gigaspora margarita]